MLLAIKSLLERKGKINLIYFKKKIEIFFSGQIIGLNDYGEIKQVKMYEDYAHAATVNQIAFCPVLDSNGKQLIASCGDDNQVKVFCV